MTQTRRSLLKKGLFGGGLLALSGVGLSLQSSYVAHPPNVGLKILTEQAYGTLLALIQHVLPSQEGFPATDENYRVAERVDALLAKMHPADGEELLPLTNNRKSCFRCRT